MVVDGFDLQALALVAPRLSAEWGTEPQVLSFAFSSTLVGLGLGAGIFGPFGDRFGRRPVLAGALIAVSLASIATMFAANLAQLTVLRFILGLAMGGANVSALALTADFAPPRRRFLIMTLVVSNMASGSALAGAVAPAVVAGFGWQGPFLLGGVLPILLLPLVWKAPESLPLLAAIGPDRFASVLRKVWPGADPADIVFADRAAVKGRWRVLDLFLPALRWRTMLLWSLYGLGSFNLFLIMSWLPVMLIGVGFAESASAYGVVAAQLGGWIGGAMVALVLDRNRMILGLTSGYLVAAVALASLIVMPLQPALWFGALFLVGIGIFGNQVVLLNVATAIYPPHLRATSSGATTAFARIVSVFAPFVGAIALSQAIQPRLTLAAIAIPMLLQIVLLLLGRRWIAD